MASPQLKQDFLQIDDNDFSRDLSGSLAYSPDKALRPEDLNMTGGGRDRSNSRQSSSRRGLNPAEKSVLLKDAEDEYKEVLRQLEEDENVTREDIENFKKNALVHKSLLEVRRRAKELQEIRSSPERYHKVQSKIGQNIQTQVRVSSHKYGASPTTMSSSQHLYTTIHNYTVSRRENPFDITEEEFNKVQQMQLSDKSLIRLTQRDQQISQAEQYLEDLLKELKDRRPYHEKIKTYRKIEGTAVNIDQVIAVSNHHGNPNAELLTTDYKQLDVAEDSFEEVEEQQQDSFQQQPSTNPPPPQPIQQTTTVPTAVVAEVTTSTPNKVANATPQQTVVNKKGPAKVGMRPGGIHGQQLEKQKTEAAAVTENNVIRVKPKPEIQQSQRRPSQAASAKKQKVNSQTQSAKKSVVKQDTPQKQASQDGDAFIANLVKTENVINITSTKDGHRVLLTPPNGADGCVLLIEKRADSQNNKQQSQPQVFQVNKVGTQNKAQSRAPQRVKQNSGLPAATNTTIQATVQTAQPQPQLQPQPQPQPQVVASSKSSSKFLLPNGNNSNNHQQEEDKRDSSVVSSGAVSEGSRGPDNFGVLARKEKSRVEKDHGFGNKDLNEKTQALQDEFESILQELNERRVNRNGEHFYQAINDFYKEGVEAHESPTRRLIQQKNTTFDHKITMKDNIQKGDYAFTYTPGPGKSYIIEPHGGELNYKLAQKDPNKFYDQVFNQDLTKHTVGQDKEVLKKLDEEGKSSAKKAKVPVTVKSKVTKRPHLKILEKLISKLTQKLTEKIGQELGLSNIMSAMKDKSVKEQIEELIAQDKLHIVDQSNKVLYEKEMREIGVKRQQSLTITQKEKSAKKVKSGTASDNASSKGGPQIEIDQEIDEQEIILGAVNGAQTKTHLKIAEKDLKKIQTKVIEAHRRNSYRT